MLCPHVVVTEFGHICVRQSSGPVVHPLLAPFTIFV